MTTIYILATILQSIGISLGVGSSTLAIVNFFKAIGDGVIDETERSMMGVVYVVLRVAMGLILVTTSIQAITLFSQYGENYFFPFVLATWTLIFVLFANAFAMTKHLVPSSFGPSIQAGSWYTLGVLSALYSLQMTDFTYFQFVVGYLAVIALATAIVNGIIMHQKSQAKERKDT